MKKLLFIAGCIVCLCSCKQTYNCKCTNGQSYELKETVKSDAAAKCDGYDNVCPPGAQCVTSWDCGLE